jgi:hypothetical protein
MDSYERRVNRLLKGFDKDLKCTRGSDGVYRVIQLVPSWTLYDIDGTTIAYPQNETHHVFSLTDNWSGRGRPVMWGLEPIFQKLRDISFDRRDQMIEEVFKSQEKAQESRDRQAMSKFEDIASETRDIYKKTFSDTLTHSLDMTKDPRRKYERKTKWR